jgi:hypothetical protein
MKEERDNEKSNEMFFNFFSDARCGGIVPPDLKEVANMLRKEFWYTILKHGLGWSEEEAADYENKSKERAAKKLAVVFLRKAYFKNEIPETTAKILSYWHEEYNALKEACEAAEKTPIDLGDLNKKIKKAKIAARWKVPCFSTQLAFEKTMKKAKK